MRRFAEAKDAITLVAEDDALGIAGFVIVHLEAAQGGCRGYVVTLDVAPEFRRLGLAGQLMDEVERQVGLRGADRVELHAFSGNEAGIAFYETRGYTRVETRRGYYGVGIDAYVYRKTLTQ